MSDRPFNLSDDRRKVTVQVAEGPDVFIRLDVDEILALIRRLSHMRRQMEPAVSRRFTQSKAYDGTGNPAWAVERQVTGENVILHICEPSIDWLHFALSPDQARRLGELLIASAEVSGSTKTQ